MLVLSRQKNQKVRFPGLGISVEILDVRGSKVSVGVDAPLEIRVLRDEIEEFEEGAAPKPPHIIRLPQTVRHELRNTLHELSLMLHVYHKQHATSAANSAAPIDSEKMFEAVIGRLESLAHHGVFDRSGVVASGPEAPTHRGSLKSQALVVDDNDNERELLAGFLRMCGYEVETAADGLEALELLESGQVSPAFMLIDMQMPRCNGARLLQNLQKKPEWNQIHRLVISGSAADEYEGSAADGYTHWFQKPLDPRQIVGALVKLEEQRTSVA